MWLKNIQIVNFRNFSRLSLEFSPHINFFEGENSQGKTNLIEAIYCLGRGISFRTFREERLIKWEEEGFYLEGEGERNGNLFRYEVSLRRGSKKVRKVNSHPVPLKNSRYWLWMVLFSVQDNKIIQGAPSYRREFLDEVVSFLYPGFSYKKFSFDRVLIQRNILLKEMKEKGNFLKKKIEGWDFQFLKLGSEIVYLRLEVLKKLLSCLLEIYPRMKGKPCSPCLIYNSSFLEEGDTLLSFDEIKNKFSNKIKEARKKEMEVGTSLVGPHRDDFCLKVDGVDQRVFGSQGDQKTAAIALRLAEVELLKRKENEVPIILLDDVPSELDFKRTNFLLKLLKEKGQIFLATQSSREFDREFLQNGSFFYIREGKVSYAAKKRK